MATLYNHAFHQVVSLDASGFISVWEVASGAQCFTFKVLDSKAKDAGEEVNPSQPSRPETTSSLK